MGAPRHASREEARRLRSEGLSLRAIAIRVGASLSSISVWVRDVELTEDQVERLHPPARPKRPSKSERSVPDGLRVCGRCSMGKPYTEFSRDGAGWQSWCKACFKAYFAARRTEHQAYTRAAHARRRAAARQLVDEVRGAAACTDCGVTRAACLEFDHVGEKTANVAFLVGEGARPSRLLAEIAECEIVCVCCHRRRTHARRLAEPVAATAAHLDAGRRRNERFVRLWAGLHGCIDCGERDPVVLDYDHVDGKTELVSTLAHRGVRIGRLFDEMLRCEIRCANCHRLRHHHERRETAA